MKSLIQIAIGILLFASSAHAVSQVGGGKAQNATEGFALNIPSRLSAGVQIFKNDGIQLRPPQALAGIGFGFGHSLDSQPINIYMLQTSFPDLKTQSRNEAHDFFIQRGWTNISAADTCVEALQVAHGDTISTALLWGNGNGIVIVVPNTSDGKAALATMVNSLTVLPGSCAWK